MSSGTHYYKFENKMELRDYLKDDLRRIAYCIEQQNIVCEEQFEKLDSHLIEEHGDKLRELLVEITGEEIIYDYEPSSAIFFLYAYNNMSREDAFKEAKKWNEFYFGHGCIEEMNVGD